MTDQANTATAWRNRSPAELNFLRPNGFWFFIQKLPLVSYFSQVAGVPNIHLGTATQFTPFVDIPRSGDKLTFSELVISFRIQETMENYFELFNWMQGLGFPESRDQFKAIQTDTLKTGLRQNNSGEYSDASLIVLDANNNPCAEFEFQGCVPTNLSIPTFKIDSADTEYLQATASFAYQAFVPRPIAVPAL